MSSLSYPIIWPSITDELAPFLKYCKGLVLNAGSGQRDIQLGKRDLNIDIVPDNKPDIIADLHAIPLQDNSVDTIVSVAVLEHTRYPWIVAEEFYRVLKPGGYGVIGVPFLQPQHACPSDYIRFTENGLIELMKYVGFEVIETAHVHHFGQTLAWLLWEYLQENMPKNELKLKLWLWLIRQLSKGTFLGNDSSNTHNTHYVIAHKPKTGQSGSIDTTVFFNDRSPIWFYSLLACPNTRQALHLEQDHLVSQDGRFTYTISDSRPILLPHTDPRDWKTVVLRDGMMLPDLTPSATSPTVAPIPQSDAAGSVSTAKPASEPTIPVVPTQPDLWLLSEQSFEISFKSPVAAQLKQANPSKIAVLATNEYEGIFKNGGIGTHYKTLSEQLAQNGWQVILFLCTYDHCYGGTSSVPVVSHIFSICDLPDVLNLQPVHQTILAKLTSEWKYWIDHQSFSCLLFSQAISTLFPDLPIYIEFHEMTGIGYHTIQAKQSQLLGANCVIGVTMHSGHEWIYEANQWFAEEYPPYYQQACDYEQFSYETADLTFFPSYYLKDKVESYGWRTGDAKHMPYFVPILQHTTQSESLVDPAVSSAVLEHPRSKVPVIFFGRLEMRKGIITFVEAIKRLSPEIREQIHVHFVGKVVRLHASKFGDLESDRYVQQVLEDQVTYTLHPDFYSHQALQFIRALKSPIVCLASHQENFPNTGLEMGQLPVSLVVSDTGGFRETLEFVNRKTGIYWFKPADPAALSDMLSKAFFNQPEVPKVPDVADLEATNRQLWDRKLDFIETALNQATDDIAPPSPPPKVTVGVVAGRVGKRLMDCLISIETQTYDTLEVIVVDNAADPDTQAVLEEARAIFQTYQFIQANGLSKQQLIERATGDYFLWLDGNTQLLPFAIEVLMKTVTQSQAEVVISPRFIIGTAPRLEFISHPGSLPAMLQVQGEDGICSLFATSLLRKLQFPNHPDDRIQNWYLLSAAIATGARLVRYPYPLYHYRPESGEPSSPASASKVRYDLRQYLAQIPPAEWSPRQINMLMLAVQEFQAQQEKCQAQVQQAQAETQQVRAELEAVRQTLQKARGNVRGTQETLEQTQLDLQQARERIHAMETSKFWKLRQGWFKVKQRLNLPSNE